ncbi:hypothetical protein [Arthrobacter sp. NPDC089319]|uniref:hypothetical protein n=1 Tax=Arthrobacter sp. NPDC089319 TaxID=3155915 RepID=UPI0034453AC4
MPVPGRRFKSTVADDGNRNVTSQLWGPTDIVPSVIQIEQHPFVTQPAEQTAAAAHGIRTQAWSPIGGITFYPNGVKPAGASWKSPLARIDSLDTGIRTGPDPAEAREEIFSRIVPGAYNELRISGDYRCPSNTGVPAGHLFGSTLIMEREIVRVRAAAPSRKRAESGPRGPRGSAYCHAWGG